MGKSEAGYRVGEIEHYPLSNHSNPTENRDSEKNCQKSCKK